jgi:hypothetical protein
MLRPTDLLEILQLGERLHLTAIVVERTIFGELNHRVRYENYMINDDKLYYIYTDNVQHSCPIKRIDRIELN